MNLNFANYNLWASKSGLLLQAVTCLGNYGGAKKGELNGHIRKSVICTVAFKFDVILTVHRR